MRLRCEQLEPRDCPAGTTGVLLAAAGGVVYEHAPGGWEVRARAFESDVPATLAHVGDRVYVGAGVGGGPRIVAFDDRTYQQTDSFYVGDPASRSGVSVLGYTRPTAGLTSTDPRVQYTLDRIPPLAVDLSGLEIRSTPTVAWPYGDALGVYQPGLNLIDVRREAPPFVALHEVGHAVAWHAWGDFSEATASDFAFWVQGRPDPRFDALLAH